MRKQVSATPKFYKYLALCVFAVALTPVSVLCVNVNDPLSAGGAHALVAIAKGSTGDEVKPNAESQASGDESAGKSEKKSKGEAAPKAASPAVNDKKPYAEDAIKHYNRGVELHQSGFLNQAITEYKAAIEADGRMEEAFSNLGVIYAAQRNYPRAREAFTTALSLKPKRPTTLNGLGTVLYAQGHIKEAKEKWLQALAVDPGFASAFYNIGNACESEKNFPEALNIYSQAITVAPNMADAYYRMGSIYYKEHHFPQASLMLRRAIELAPNGDFVNEAKRIERNLEEELNKRENQLGGHTATAKEESGANEAHSRQHKKKGKSGMDMFLQPAGEQANDRHSAEGSIN